MKPTLICYVTRDAVEKYKPTKYMAYSNLESIEGGVDRYLEGTDGLSLLRVLVFHSMPLIQVASRDLLEDSLMWSSGSANVGEEFQYTLGQALLFNRES